MVESGHSSLAGHGQELVMMRGLRALPQTRNLEERRQLRVQPGCPYRASGVHRAASCGGSIVPPVNGKCVDQKAPR